MPSCDSVTKPVTKLNPVAERQELKHTTPNKIRDKGSNVPFPYPIKTVL